MARIFFFTSAALLAMVAISTAMMIKGKQMSMDGAIMAAASNKSMSKMFEIMQDNDTVMVEMDMLYKMDAYMEMRKEMDAMENQTTTQGRRKKRKATTNTGARWTNRRVPYDMNNVFSSSDRQVIMSAIADYHQYTCLRFVPASSTDRNRIRFVNGGGCSSYVGMIGNVQPVTLAPGCRYKGIVIHELGHAIGFQHEQTRPDRDGFVYINTQNIQQGVAYNFMRYPASQVSSYGVPYDYTSVMHYSQYAFSANGQPTILARDSRFQNAMGNRDGFSFKDIQLANTIYDCAADNGCAARTCPQGFQGPDCRCWCDSGNRANPVKICDGTVATVAPVASTPRPTSRTTRAPLNCQDSNQYCSQWADFGYCTDSRYLTFMSTNCRFSCGTCATTTVATTTPTVTGCTDNNQYCATWAENGECSRNPSYMSVNCQKSCDTCNNPTPDCEDMSTYCPGWERYCEEPAYSSYLSMNCMKTCGTCTASDVAIKPSTTTQPPIIQAGCADKDPKCPDYQNKCMISLRVRSMCPFTCDNC